LQRGLDLFQTLVKCKKVFFTSLWLFNAVMAPERSTSSHVFAGNITLAQTNQRVGYALVSVKAKNTYHAL